ncbi:glycoside hydrolase family 32 protein [Lacrimispora sp.]|uniref:glycoside hydrolase family 32 protein n=1 Tax=Lacrimispora sp. TaxID=2719234 RepID=UPI0034615B33
MFSVKSDKYRMLEIFARPVSKASRSLLTWKGNGKTDAEEREITSEYYEWVRIPLVQDEVYQLTADNLEISLAYLSGNDDVMSSGIGFLDLIEGKDAAVVDSTCMKAQYDTPYREQYHFQAFRNWINDPNGLCWFNGRYHMFYQHNPHSQEWNNMYWGHAVSLDLVHWVHLPFVLQPQKEILQDCSKKGGAFSGSALVEGDKVKFYLTRHIGPRIPGSEQYEYQTMMESSDMIHFTEEKTVIETPPSGVNPGDFRDPKVWKSEGYYYMVLASKIRDKAAILLYGSEDSYKWNYIGPLLEEETRGISTFECPDAFELDRKFVAMGAWMTHHDECGRYQMTRYYIGEFNGSDMEVECSEFLDFGSNYYAGQSFLHQGKRILIGWISDFYKEHVAADNGSYGSMAIPRILSVKNNKLYMEPVPDVYTLQDQCLLMEKGKSVKVSEIPGNSYLAKVSLKENSNTDFTMLIAKDHNKTLCLMRKNGKVEIVSKGTAVESIRFPAQVQDVHYIEIFMDRRVVEVYLNHGESVGTKLFYSDGTQGVFEADFVSPEEVEGLELYTMKSIW